MKAVAIGLLIVALHLGLASVAASRHLLSPEWLSVPQQSCDAVR